MRFSDMKSERDVSVFFGVSVERLRFLLYGKSVNYRIDSIEKRSGGNRELRIPIGMIRLFQKKLKVELDAVYHPRMNVYGFIKGRSMVEGARRHVGMHCVLNLDLKDFFGSINFGRVRGLFMSRLFGFNNTVATLLAQVCCFQGSLPTGACTSPVLSNLVCRSLDRALAVFSSKNRVLFSRYADDITFSSKTRFGSGVVLSANPVELSRGLIDLIKGQGFEINFEKTWIRFRSERQEVTGVVVNCKVNIENKRMRRMRSFVYRASRDGCVDELGRVYGVLGYVGMVRGVDDVFYAKLKISSFKLSHKVASLFGRAGIDANVVNEAVCAIEIADKDGGVEGYGSGTGFFVSGDVFLTNWHVVDIDSYRKEFPERVIDEKTGVERDEYVGFDSFDYLRVTTLSGVSRAKAHVLAYDKDYDIAVVRLKGKVPACLVIDDKIDSVSKRRGDDVVLCGYPSYLIGDPMSCVPSSVRSVVRRKTVDWILIKSEIKPGNSGGPLICAKSGKVVGIATRASGMDIDNGCFSLSSFFDKIQEWMSLYCV